jgi:hypothetical protein
LANGATSLLVESNLPPSFWGYAVQSFVYVRNHAPTSAISLSQTPYTAWFKEKPDVDHFRVFGCIAYVHVQKDQRRGLLSAGLWRVDNTQEQAGEHSV